MGSQRQEPVRALEHHPGSSFEHQYGLLSGHMCNEAYASRTRFHHPLPTAQAIWQRTYTHKTPTHPFPCLAPTNTHFRPRIVQDTLLGAVATQLLSPGCEVVSLYHRRLEHGYPTPCLGRDAVLEKALPWLKEHRIWSRGRFGSYKVRE